MAAATRRASYRSSSVQQVPKLRSPPVSPDASYNCIDKPMTSWPSSASRAAATDESPPPDIATAMRIWLESGSVVELSGRPHSQAPRYFWHGLARQAAELLNDARQHGDDTIDFFLRREKAETEAQRVLSAMSRKAHRPEDVRGLKCSRRTGRSG